MASLASALCATALAGEAPKIEFDQAVHDFGQVSHVESVSASFKFRNTGDAVLKLAPPKPSCGCTVAELKPDTLQPGESGELPFTLNLGRVRATMEKHITVKSNDPQTPEVVLTVKAQYTPLYDVNPVALPLNLPLEVQQTNRFVTLTRTDGKPLEVARLEASQPWITAKVEDDPKAAGSTARVRVAVKRDGPPRRFNERVHVFAADQTNNPVATIFLYGHFLGEIAVSPEALYWSVTDPAKLKDTPTEALVTRRVKIRSASGAKFELKNAQSSLATIKVEIVSKEPGRTYELIAKLSEVPGKTISGNVSLETSLATQPKIDLPMTVSVSTR